ncbi:unnamed protein product [Darwinula stevensoni]|uniref:Transducer of regulated CREB activity N-terminal domain-containing protein n=1 Tax=Darwinula stevensoni TaxID=69355 RepID=A0A7R9A4Z6_9CRUS|nr:unnamed protein product [Darwinula stevensoni]CAG0894540.1 unnamed protein product [Darwinula stevensoni]
MSSPRKSSDKIALNLQNQAEDATIFDTVQRDVQKLTGRRTAYALGTQGRCLALDMFHTTSSSFPDFGQTSVLPATDQRPTPEMICLESDDEDCHAQRRGDVSPTRLGPVDERRQTSADGRPTKDGSRPSVLVVDGSRTDSNSTGVGHDRSPLAVSPARMLQTQSAAGTRPLPGVIRIAPKAPASALNVPAFEAHPPVDSGLHPVRMKSKTGGEGSAKKIKVETENECESIHDPCPPVQSTHADDAGRWDLGCSESYDTVRYSWFGSGGDVSDQDTAINPPSEKGQ